VAPDGARVIVRLRRAGRTVKVARTIAGGGRFAATFRTRRTGRFRAVATIVQNGERSTARSRFRRLG
jgi:hypothetical protein